MALHFEKTEFADRMARLKARLAEERLDAALLFAQESMYWLTGYDTFGFCFFQCLVVKADGEMALLTRSADLRQARHTSIIDNIAIWTDRANAHPATDLRNLMDDLGLLGCRVGVEYATHGLTAANGRALDDTLRTFCETTDMSGLVDDLRVVKSPAEIAYAVRAAELADDALDAALPLVKTGGDEAAILAAMQGAIFAGGGDYPGNGFIIGSGEDALLCRYKAGRRVLGSQDQLTLEWAGVYRQYHAAMMRTVVVGKASSRHQELFEAAKAALEACEAAMQPNRTFGDVFAAHARALDEAGLSRHRLNACGYSLGARYAPSWMEKQMFYADSPEPIRADMTLFAHMILFDSETGAAMTLGQTYLTTHAAPKRLSRHAPELLVRA